MGIKFGDVPDNVPNDSSLPTRKIVEIMERDGIVLKYGEIAMGVRQQDYEVAKARVALYVRAQQQELMERVDENLRKSAPKIQNGKFSKKVADNFYADLMIWNALKELGLRS